MLCFVSVNGREGKGSQVNRETGPGEAEGTQDEVPWCGPMVEHALSGLSKL